MTFDPRVDFRPLPQDRGLTPEQQKIKAAAREFEAIMLHQMLKTMRSTVKPGALEGGSTMATYRDMMDEQTARSLAHGRGVGLADVIARQMMELDKPAPKKP
ncbi:rod-binding protein [bacterium]|nr:rod-binding protein [bacterium]